MLAMVLFTISVKEVQLCPLASNWPFQLASQEKHGIICTQSSQWVLETHHKNYTNIILAVFFIISFHEQLTSVPTLFIIFASCAGQRIPRVLEEGSAALGYAYHSGIAWVQVMLFLTIPLTAEWLSYKLCFVDGIAGNSLRTTKGL